MKRTNAGNIVHHQVRLTIGHVAEAQKTRGGYQLPSTPNIAPNIAQRSVALIGVA
ncbi:MAG TPA: hypothetical protein VGM27_00675 [Acidobacteriaceae bacterium]|jgi:hypothetical protein